MRIAIVGAGRQGARHGLSIEQTRQGTVAAVVDPNRARGECLAAKHGAKYARTVDEVLESATIDVVVIATPVALHQGQTIRCLLAGKHVFCEKPLAMTSQQAQNMVNVADSKGLILQCGFIMRHHPGIQMAKSWLDAGLVGKPIYGVAHYARSKNFAGTWRANKDQSGGGNLHDQAIHVLDLFTWFLGGPLDGVCYLSAATPQMATLEDNVAGILRSPENAIAAFHVSYTRWSPHFSFEIGGDAGLIRIDGLGNSDYGTQRATLILRDDDTLLGTVSDRRSYFDRDEPWKREWNDFCNAVESDHKPLGRGQDGVEALKLVEKLYFNSSHLTANSCHHTGE